MKASNNLERLSSSSPVDVVWPERGGRPCGMWTDGRLVLFPLCCSPFVASAFFHRKYVFKLCHPGLFSIPSYFIFLRLYSVHSALIDISLHFQAWLVGFHETWFKRSPNLFWEHRAVRLQNNNGVDAHSLLSRGFRYRSTDFTRAF